jgi:hypothetical protein
MKKKPNSPMWKKGMMSSPPVYHPPQELADPEAHLTEEQKKWPAVGDWAVPPEKVPGPTDPTVEPAAGSSESPPTA